MPNVKPAGYILSNNEAIWGFGDTPDEARDMFNREMAMNGVEVVGDDVDTYHMDNAWTRESDYKIESASAGLLLAVGDLGGAITWRHMNGVACTEAEQEAAFD